ncbi:MAG: CHRD domain-containing protein [Vicinamibacterales bacterium]
MKRFAALLVMALAALGAAACDDNPNDPDDDTIVFTATMSGTQEVPPATGAEAGATGTATITFNLTRGAGDVITAATANFSSTVSNMPAGSTLILAHIHTGAAGTAGGPVVNTGLSAATAIPIVNGTATLTFNNITITDPATAQSIIDNPAAFYFNVHSAANPGGVVRGQLVRQGS